MQHLTGTLVRRKNRVKHFLNFSLSNKQRQSFDEPRAIYQKCRQAQGIAQFEIGVAQDLKWHAEPTGHFPLILVGLCAATEDLDV